MLPEPLPDEQDDPDIECEVESEHDPLDLLAGVERLLDPSNPATPCGPYNARKGDSTCH
ncbi:MAG: hypothetical protein KF768_07775 [Phycisphaeraceae bacterium]|nr:hypothetical protein [Phycisphaeraceae bacterium]